MPARNSITLTSVLLALALAGCDGGEKSAEKAPPKKSRDLHGYEQAPTPEELAKMREAAGHQSQDAIAAENAAMFEKGAREWIKTRMTEYRDFSKDFRDHLDTIEKEAPKWKDQAAFDKFNEKYSKRAKEFTDTYDTLTGKGAEGGNTQVVLGKAFRDWEALKDELGPQVAEQERFPEVLKTIRESLDELDKALDDIEADETLEVNPLYKPAKKKK